MHSIEYKYSPKAFANVWQKNSERYTGHELRNDDDYALPHPRLEIFKKIPLYSLPVARNALGDLKYKQNRTTFRIALKAIQYC
jgi:hypothetical protein